jgi:ABC-type transporter Mla subunit MlaD
MPDFDMIFSVLGAPLAWLMGRAFHVIHQPRFPETVSLILLLWMIWCLFRCWREVNPTWRRLAACRASLAALAGDQRSLEGFQDFEALIAKSRDALGGCWARFRMTLVVRDDHLVFLTTQPEAFFNLSSLRMEAPLRRFGKWSGLFVGIGLLVTFLGLVAALNSATLAIQAATAGGEGGTESMQNALKGLLSAATFKFYTSIFGLLASLVVSYTEKRFRRILEMRVKSLCQELERLLPLLTPEQLLADQVREAKQTTTQLKQFNTEMAEGLMHLSGAMAKALQESVAPVHQELSQGFQATTSAVSESMTRALQESITPVRQSLDQVGQNLGAMEQTIGRTIGENLKAMQERTLDTLADKLGSVVNQQAGAELGTLTKTLESLTSSLSGMTSSLDQGGGAFAETLEHAARELRAGVAGLAEVTENIGKSINHDMALAQQALQERLAAVGAEMSARGQEAAAQLTSGTSTVLGTLQGSLAGISTQVERLIDSLAKADHALNGHRQAVGEAATLTQSAAQNLDRAAGSLGSAAGPMANSVRGMETSLKSMLDGAIALGASVQQAETAIRQAAGSLEQNWQKHLGRFQGMDEGLAKVLQHIAHALDSNTTKVSEYVQKIDQHLGNAVSQFAQGVEDLDEVLTEHLRSHRAANQQ